MITMFCVRPLHRFIFAKGTHMKKFGLPYNEIYCKSIFHLPSIPKISLNKRPLKDPKTSLLNTLLEHKQLGSKEWKTFRKSLLKDSSVNSVNIDATVMNFCLSNKQLSLANSYVSHLNDIGSSPNIATLGKLIKLYYMTYKDCKIPYYEQMTVTMWCNELRKKNTLDANTCENLIHGLCLTEDWIQSLRFLQMIEITAKPSASAYSVVIQAANDNNKHHISTELVEKMVNEGRIPKCEVFVSWINYCMRTYKDKQVIEHLENMLKFIGNNDIHVSKIVADKLVEVFKTLNWTGNYTTISPNGQCLSCKEKLIPISFSNEEFSKLKEDFINRVLVRGNAFVRTTPDELTNYMNYINKRAPYNVIIDGLNVGYSAGGRKKKMSDLADTVSAVVRYFADRRKKILVLGRKHMTKWPAKGMAEIKSQADIFLTENTSYDDPYLLYAALHSGPETNFVSRDLMRSHAFLLEDRHLRMYFKKWQQKHQYQLISVINGKVLFKEPLKYLPTAHNSYKGWHIPYVEQYDPNPAQTLSAPLNWLCLCQKSSM